jgi:hypothetical protein
MKRSLSYDEFKKENKKALSSLITLWSELSRCSRETARKDLKENWGLRYEVSYKPQYPLNENYGVNALTFIDDDSGDAFSYDKKGQEWG